MRSFLGVVGWIALGASTWAAVPSPSPEAGREVRLVGSSTSGAVAMEIRADPALCPGLAPREMTVAVPGNASVEVSGCATWTLICRGKAFCSATLAEPAFAEVALPVTVDVVPAATARGRIHASPPAALPRQIRVAGRLRGGAHDTTEMEFSFASEVDEEGRISFNVPAGAVDLRIAAKDLAPAYRWNVRPRDGVVDLGRFEMVPGGSVLGYVVDAETGFPVPGARVTALPAGLEDYPVDDREATESIRAPSAETNDHGSFQLTSISAGAYRLRAEHPDYLTVEPAEVNVVRDAETLLRGDVVLSKPLRLRLEIDPPRSPRGELWEVVLRDPVTSTDLAAARADSDGVAELDHLAPGTVRVVVEANGAAGAFTTDVELAADLDLPIEIPLVEVIGHVTINDEPVRGEVEVRTGAGDAWAATLDDDGRFQVWSREPRFDFILLLVKGEGFAIPPLIRVENAVVEDRKIELEVELLDLEISGVVTTLRGAPVRDADVVIQQLDQIAAHTESREDGSFTVRPLQAGEYRVSASQRGVGTSQHEVLILAKSTPVAEARLVIRPSRKLEGFVVGPSGEAVGGARVIAMSVDHDYVADDAVTDVNGRFGVKVAPDSRQVVLIVAARGYPYWSACVSSTQEARLRLAGSGGLLETQVDQREDLPIPAIGQPLLVNESGGVLPFVEVLRWSLQHGGGDGTNDRGEPVFRVPNVAAGRWAMVWAEEPQSAIVVRSCNRTLFQDLEWVTVNPGETTRLLWDRNR